MTEHAGGPGPWLAVGVLLAAPALYMIRVMSAGWTPWHTAIVLAIGGAVAWRFAGVFGAGAEHALRNRRVRDDARTIEVQARTHPALPDTHREAALIQAQAAASASLGRAAAVWERMDSGAQTAARPPIPVRVWTDGYDDEGGYDDDVV